jgi:hypothetical protein
VTTFPIRFTGANKAMAVLGMSPRNSGVQVGDDRVEIRMAWAFRVAFDRSNVAAATPDTARVWGWGVHGWRGSYLVNGSSSGIVRIDLASPVTGRLLGIPVKVRTVRVSVDDPAALIEALT